jgi:Ca2+-binding RTX toxin-like protein
VSTLADVDGLGLLHYDWQRNTGSGFVSTGAADQATYTLGDADVGGTVRVVISYTDGQGFAESATSAATAAVLNINDPHTGLVGLNGIIAEHQVLTADTSTLADADGLGTLHYQWQRNDGGGFNNVGLDQATYTLGAVDIGGNMRVVVSYTDGHGTAESQTSPTTIAVADVNDPATVALSNIHAPIFENASTAVHIKMADITVTDPDPSGNTNVLSLSGVDAGLFEIVGNELFLRAGAHLDYETNPVLNVNVNVDDAGVPGSPDGTAAFALNILDIAENITGTPGNDRLTGTNNGETISGLAGNDRIIGLGGNDRIIGGLGVDTMTGGPGNDVFVFTSPHDSAPGISGLLNNGGFSPAVGQSQRDIITDFTHGQDKIDLSGMDANIRVAGNQAFSWRGTGNFTHAPGQLIERIYNPAGTASDRTIIYGDISGDGRADFQIELTGLKTLVVSDFIL